MHAYAYRNSLIASGLWTCPIHFYNCSHLCYSGKYEISCLSIRRCYFHVFSFFEIRFFFSLDAFSFRSRCDADFYLSIFLSFFARAILLAEVLLHFSWTCHTHSYQLKGLSANSLVHRIFFVVIALFELQKWTDERRKRMSNACDIQRPKTNFWQIGEPTNAMAKLSRLIDWCQQK